MTNRIVSISVAVVLALSVGLIGCTAEVPEIMEYTLTISSTEGGSVTTPGEGTFTYDEGEKVNLIAIPDGGYRFVNWTGDVGEIADVEDATTTITINGDYTITANLALGIAVQNWYDLGVIRNSLGGTYILMNDLDSTTAGYAELASPTTNGGKGWQPIGTPSNPFSGSLDGQGYEIRDLFIDRPEQYYVGLFSAVGGLGIVKNVGVMNATVTGTYAVGGLVGRNHGTVSDSYATGRVTGNDSCVGGLVGDNDGGAVSNSYSTANVTGSTHVGGLVGQNCHQGTISNSYSSGNVTGYHCVGGLVGCNFDTVSDSYSAANVTGTLGVGGLVGGNGEGAVTMSNSYSTASVTGDDLVGGLVVDSQGTVSNSYSTGSVTGSSYAGGLAGTNHGTVNNSYSTASVTGNDLVGGLVGWNGGTVSDSYSAGSVTGASVVGGLVGYRQSDGTVTNSFWDVQTSGQTTSASGTGMTTAEMQDIAIFAATAWNIIAVANPGMRNPSYIWNIVDGQTYPFLSWQP